jgi:plastocyanin
MNNSLKAALFAVCLSFASPSAFCGGRVTGKIDGSMEKYIQGAVVYLKGVPGGTRPKTAIVQQKNLQFIPHVVAVPVGTTVSFINRDKVNHDIYSSDSAKTLDINTSKPGIYQKEVFDKAGVVNLLCTIHAEMSGYIVVVDSNYYAVTGADGKFSIRDVPPGKYEVAVWSEKLKSNELTMVTVKNGKNSRVEINLGK